MSWTVRLPTDVTTATPETVAVAGVDVPSVTFATTLPPEPARTNTGPGMPTAHVTVGSVASRFTSTEDDVVPPALVASHVSSRPVVSAFTVVGSQPVCDEIADSGSSTVQETSTLLTYQPLEPRVPVTEGVMTGGVVSVGVDSRAKPQRLAVDVLTVISAPPPASGERCATHGSGSAGGGGASHSATWTLSFSTCTVVWSRPAGIRSEPSMRKASVSGLAAVAGSAVMSTAMPSSSKPWGAVPVSVVSEIVTDPPTGVVTDVSTGSSGVGVVPVDAVPPGGTFCDAPSSGTVVAAYTSITPSVSSFTSPSAVRKYAMLPSPE